MTAPYAPMVDPTAIEVRRVCAWTIDLLLFLALVVGVLAATGGMDIETKTFATAGEAITYCDSIDTDNGRRACSPYQDQAVIVSMKGSADGVWLANSIFYVVLQGLTGGSIGKLLLGLRVVDINGQRAGLSKSFVRTFLWIVDAITCGLPVVGGILMTTKPGHQRFGDRVAGTYVVRKESVGMPIVLPPPTPAPYVFQMPPPGYPVPPGYGPPPPGYPAPPGAGPAAHGPPPYPPPAAPGFGAPGPSPFETDRPASRPSVDAPDSDGPHWDDDRDTYIQYDRAVEMWVQWDDHARHWRPIET